MKLNDTEKYRILNEPALRLERGGRYGRPSRRTPDVPSPWLDREMQAVFAGLHGAKNALPSTGIYDAAEGRQWPWRKIARRIREAHASGTPIEAVKRIVRVLDTYVDHLYTKKSA